MKILLFGLLVLQATTFTTFPNYGFIDSGTVSPEDYKTGSSLPMTFKQSFQTTPYFGLALTGIEMTPSKIYKILLENSVSTTGAVIKLLDL